MEDPVSRIEHTVLGPLTTWAAVTDVLDAADRYGMRACLAPCYLAEATEYAPDVPVVTVIGFPHGQETGAAKVAAARCAVDDGAAELDVVANLGRLVADEDERVLSELAELVAAVSVPVKVIVEAPLLDDADLRRACATAQAAGADFVKTATGFADGGALVEDVRVMAEYLPVKASGGIGSRADAEAMFAAGAERIGASAGDEIAAAYRGAGN